MLRRTWRIGVLPVLAGLVLAMSSCSSAQDDPQASGPQDSGSPVPNPQDPKDPKDPQAPIDCSTLQSTGLEVGDVAPNLTLLNGEGQEVKLHDFCNDNLILIASEY